MMHAQDNNLPQEVQRRHSEELSLQPGSAALMVSFLLTLNVLAAFLDYPPDALLVIDSAGTIVLANTQAEILFGYDQDELLGQTIECLIPEHLRTTHIAQRTHYLQEPRSRPMGVGLDLVGQRKDGSQFPVEISLRPIRIEHTLHVIGAIRDMTDQRQSEREQLRISQRLLQQDKLLSLSHDAILVCDPENRIVFWNEGAKQLYGWTAQEVMGQITHTLLQTRFPPSREALNQMLEQHAQWQGELTHTCRDGRQVIVESRQVLVRDEQGAPAAILEINRDVTERRRLEFVEQEARAEAEARSQVLQVILDRLPSGVFLVQGSPLCLLLANQAATALWSATWPRGQSQGDFFQQQGIQLLAANGQPFSPDEWTARQAMVTGEPVLQRQMVIRRADGTRLPVQVDALPLGPLSLFPHLSQEMAQTSPEAERVVLMMYQDVSALKEAEALKDQFISLATHELRTPVTVIMGYTDRLLSRATRGTDHPLDEWQRARMHEIKLASQHLASLTEELLDVIRMQAGQFQLARHSTDLVALTRKVVTQLQTTTNQHQLSLQITVAHLWATIDVCRIEQVLANLLSNAIKYSPGGGPIEVVLEEDEHTHEARFQIRDHGMGIPSAQQAHLFGRFVRAQNVQAAGIRGTGLGLYLCRELVERHGGSIGFESEEGVGSTFFFSLPCHPRTPRYRKSKPAA